MIKKMIHIMMFKLVERKLIVRLLRANKVKRKSRKSFRMETVFCWFSTLITFSDLLMFVFVLINAIFFSGMRKLRKKMLEKKSRTY